MAPRARLWLLLAGSLGFVVLGLALLVSDWRLGVGTLGFFGACAAVFGWQLRARGDERSAPTLLDLRGGKVLSAAAGQRAAFLVAGLVASVSTQVFSFGRDPLIWWLGGAMTVAASVALVLQAFGVPARTALRFSPEGLHFVSGAAPCLLAFDNVARIQRAEWNGHVLVALQPLDLGALLLTVEEGQRAAAAKQFRRSVDFVGAPLVLWPGKLQVNAGALMRSLERYVRDPAAREELRA